MDKCVFCKIVSGDISSYRVYEDDYFYAFLDIRPLNPGHVLVVPKKHYRWVWDLPFDSGKSPNIGEYYQAAGRIADAQRRAFGTDWIVSAVFGEEVEHAHIWLLPRFPGDGHGGSIRLDNIKKLSEREMEAASRKIRKNIRL